MTMKLYEITEDMRSLQALVDGEELTAEMVADTMDGLNIAFKDKVLACMKVRQEIMGNGDSAAKEASRLLNLSAQAYTKADKLKDYISDNMAALGEDKLDLGIFRLTLKKASIKLGEIDESKITGKYWVHIPESEKLDKRALLKDAKEFPIQGVELIDGARALIIK